MKKILQKYHKSTFKNETIKELNINSFDTVTIVTENHLETLYSSNYNETDNRQLSADYLICELQNNLDIKVRKY